ncbi:putative Serine/threonine kinase associate protein KapC [Gammaproteobacteria bacterium]
MFKFENFGKKRVALIFISLIVIVLAWVNQKINIAGFATGNNPTSKFTICNGDGICNGGETITNCPSECPFESKIGQPAVSVPVITHPRIWLNSSDLPRLQGWAVPANPMYTKGLAQAATVAESKYAFMFDAAGNPLPAWWDPVIGTDIGINGGYYATETLAAILAFHSMVAPLSQATTDAKMARTILMHIVNSAAQCIDNPNLYQKLSTGNYPPFCDPYWMSGVANRLAVGGGDTIGLIVDWIKGYEQNRKNFNGSPVDPILSTADKDNIVKVFSKWADYSAHWIQQEHPWPIDLLNDPELLRGTNIYRWPNQERMMANNYYLGRFRLLTFMALAIDSSDSPSQNSADFVSTYTNDLLGAWLYQIFGMFEQAETVKQLLLGPNVDTKGMGLGLANGGLPVEGAMYGESLGYLFQTLLALHTAGYDGKNLAGPQGSLVSSSYWDQVVAAHLHQLAPVYDTVHHVWPIAAYGDLYFNYLTSHDNLPLLASLGVYDQELKRNLGSNPGRDARLNAVKWLLLNGLERSDTPGNLYQIAGNSAGMVGTKAKDSNSPLSREAILLFLMFDPSEYPISANQAPPSDPRPSLSTMFLAKPIARVLARTDWTPNASWFTHICEWQSIGHESGVCGEFELWRKGEWLTKERSGYDSNGTPGIGSTCEYHNCLGIKNKATSPTDATGTPVKLGWYEKPIWDFGGQWIVAMGIGDPTTLSSLKEHYVYVQDDITNLYNRLPNSQTSITANDVVQAVRSNLWIKPDHIVVYDRVTTQSEGLFKHFNLVLEQGVDPVTHALLPPPSVSSNPRKVPALITETTTGGQQFYINALLPVGADIKLDLAFNWSNSALAQPEPSQQGAPNPAVDAHVNTPSGYHLQIEEPTAKDVRFLNVMQGADPSQMPDPVTLLHSNGNSATAFDGVLIQSYAGGIGTTYVFFPVNGGTVEGLKVTLVNTPDQVYVTGLTPGGSYIAGQDASQVFTLWPAAVGTQGALNADSAGVLPVTDVHAGVIGNSLMPNDIIMGADGGMDSFIVSTLNNTLNWHANSSAPWVTMIQPSGTGGGKVQFKVEPNPTSVVRTATIYVMGQTLTVSQDAMVCSNKLSPVVPNNYTASGGNGTVNIGGNSVACTWSASSNVSWINLSSNHGTGSGSINYTITPNSGSYRTGSFTVAGQTFTVNQSGATQQPTPPQNCIYGMTVNSKQVSAAGLSSGFTAKVAQGCNITVVSSNPSWLTTTSAMVKDSAGNSLAAVQFVAKPNSTTQTRTATITLAGQYPFMVTQLGQGNSCLYNINPNFQSVAMEGGKFTLKTTSDTKSTCNWIVSTNNKWIHLGQTNGSGSQTISYTVDTNSGKTQRTGTITLGGQTLSVIQD